MREKLCLAFHGLLCRLGVRSISGQFSFAFSLIIVLSGTSTFALYTSMQHSANTINIAGRQRMLSQRVAKEALLTSYGAQDPEAALATIALFEDSHTQLIAGDTENKISKPYDNDILQQLLLVKNLWQTYKTHIIQQQNNPTQQSLNAIKAQSPIILKEMNKAVGMITVASNANTTRLIYIAGACSLGILLVVLASQFLGLHWLIVQIRLLRARLIQSSQGDFSHAITSPCGNNEIGEMFNAYNKMVEQMKEVIQSLKTTTHHLTSQACQLTQSAKSSNQNLDQQNHEIGMVSSALGQMSSTTSDVANNAQKATDVVTQSHHKIQSSCAHVAEAAVNMQQLNNNMDKATQVLQKLDSESQHIGSVLTVITNIAEQTNLLALNAAIEAARAGEQGRGFAVVADEVRTLASRTQESTEEIQAIIEQLQSKSADAVSVMQASNEQTSVSKKQIDDAGQELNAVLENAQHIIDMTASIAAAAKQQSVATTEIDRSMVSINNSSTHSSQTTAQLLTTATALEDDATALEKITAVLKA